MATYNDAQDALFAAIVKTTEEVMKANGNASARSTALKELGLALRFAAGGPQPGGHA